MKLAGSLSGADADEWNAMLALLQLHESGGLFGFVGGFTRCVELELLWNAGVRYVDFQKGISLANQRAEKLDDRWGFVRTVSFTSAARSREAGMRLRRAPWLHLLDSSVTKPWEETK